DLGVFTIDRKGSGGMTLIEIAPGASLDEIKSKTHASYRVAVKTTRKERPRAHPGHESVTDSGQVARLNPTAIVPAIKPSTDWNNRDRGHRSPATRHRTRRHRAGELCRTWCRISSHPHRHGARAGHGRNP